VNVDLVLATFLMASSQFLLSSQLSEEMSSKQVPKAICNPSVVSERQKMVSQWDISAAYRIFGKKGENFWANKHHQLAKLNKTIGSSGDRVVGDIGTCTTVFAKVFQNVVVSGTKVFGSLMQCQRITRVSWVQGDAAIQRVACR
jgi:hypothetical protein